MTDTTTPPLVLRGAVGVWFALAVFGLFTVTFLWINQAKLTASLPEGMTVRDALVPLTIAAVFFGLAYGLFGWLLRRGNRRARVGLTVTAFLHLIWVVLPGVSLASMITVVLLGVGLVLTWRPAASHWLRAQ